MISEESITQISHLFCGDTEGYYLYKTGPKLVAFFNQYLGSNDIYKSGFPSRWVYVYNKIIDCINTNSVDTFFNIILGKSYLMREQGTKEQAERKIQNRVYDSDVESYIYDMSPEMISRTILDKRPGFSDALITFMRTNDNQAQHIIQSIEQSFRDVCGRSFEANDPFASFAVRVIKDEFSFVVKEIAATMLRYVAWDVNRFSVQHMVRDLLLSDLDPMLKDIIKE